MGRFVSLGTRPARKGASSVKAIDVHAHVSTKQGVQSVLDFQRLLMKYYMKMDVPDDQLSALAKEDEAMVEDFTAADIKVFLVGWDAETATSNPPLSNTYLRDLASAHPDTILGVFGCVDPRKGEAAIQEAERCVREYGFPGLKFHASAQGFYPIDRAYYPLWEACQDWGAVVQFHTGTTGLGAGAPGGGGVHLDCARPLYLDHVAADFPKLKIVLCHPGWPWTEENIMVLLHKANTFMDLSGWSPKYFPQPLKHDLSRRLKERVMFGSDYPLLPYQRLFEEYEAMGLPDDVLENIYYRNAVRILEIPEDRL
jgi:predicted TIM-barrel fold metal-dependent hydrolase